MQLKSIKIIAIIAIFFITSSTVDLIFILSIPRQALAQIKNPGKEEADKLIQQGKKQLSSHNFEAALQSYQQALMISQSIRDTFGEADAFIGLGDVYFALKNYQQAINYYQQNFTLREKISNIEQQSYSLSQMANAYSALANAYSKLKDYKQAINYYQQSLKALDQLKDILGDCKRVITTNSDIPFSPDPKKGCLDVTDADQLSRCDHQITMTGSTTGRIINQTTKIDKKCQSLSKEISKRKVNSLNTLINTYFTPRDLQQVIDLLKKGDPQTAENFLRQSIKVGKFIWTSLGDSDTLKISFFETQANTYRLLQQALIAQNKKEEALEIAEESRARAFIELIAQHQNSYLYPSPNYQQIIDIARKEKATLVVYSIAWNDLYIWVVKPSAEISLHKVDLKKIKLGNVAEDARTAAATLAEGRGIATSVITNLVRSTRSAFTKRSNNLSSLEGINPPRNLSCRGNKCLQQMYKLLIQPIAAELPTDFDSHVIFIPHESLFLVPFAALQDPTNNKFLIENHTISIAPSIEILELIHSRPMELQESVGQTPAVGVDIPQAALVVGNPTMPTIGNPPHQLDPLPGAEKEAQVIAKLLKTQALTGKQATKAAVEQQMVGAKIIHLATHGLLDELSESGIPGAVALAPSGEDNGLLSANEVLNLHLKANLVVLSACDTARGHITGDGVIGLSRSFIVAGTPSIIVSLWQVADGSTAFLMPEFYRQLEHNRNKASALRQAMLNTMKSYPNPSDWAAFVLIGESE